MIGRAVAFAMTLVVAGPPHAAEPEPAGYRTAPFNAPTPETLQGAEVIDTDEARALWRSGRVGFVDVLPRPPRPADLPKGTIWRDAPHDSIPGALWLPNTGYDALASETLDYLLGGLAEATQGDKQAPVVLFCKRDCWMSWNAAKRAMEHGYARILWYPAGVDGWAEAGFELERTEPYSP